MTIPTTFALPAAHKDPLMKAARAEERTMSNLIARAVSEYLRRHGYLPDEAQVEPTERGA
jgi:hypothetical protein